MIEVYPTSGVDVAGEQPGCMSLYPEMASQVHLTQMVQNDFGFHRSSWHSRHREPA
jgi:hypothetical protein